MVAWKIRVYSKSASGVYHTISVSSDGTSVACSCPTTDTFCSHIDAVLIANERAMVHSADVEATDAARAATVGKIAVPDGWKATWRRELGWRGLQRRAPNYNPRQSGKPLVCFTGTLPGKTRKQWIAEAKENGWETTDEPSRFTDVLVAADPEGSSAKLRAARSFSTAIVSAEEWQIVMVDGVLA